MSNSSGASSYDNSIEHESDEDFKVKLPVNIGMKLRERRIQGYIFYFLFLIGQPCHPFLTIYTFFFKSIFYL